MKHTLIKLRADGSAIVETMSSKPSLEMLQRAVGGYIEIVPYFTTCTIDGVTYKGEAYCNEYGKIEDMPRNERATKIWERNVPGLSDHLRGDVVFVSRQTMTVQDRLPGVTKAIVLMERCNGGVNRYRTEADVLKAIGKAIPQHGLDVAFNLTAIDKYLDGLSDDDLLNVVDGDQDECKAFMEKTGAPAGTNELLEFFFDNASFAYDD